jgi:hypothetical protein
MDVPPMLHVFVNANKVGLCILSQAAARNEADDNKTVSLAI